MEKPRVDVDRFDRQKRVDGWDQTAVANARCLVLGAGALGNEVVKNLLQLGVKRVSLVDFDVVQEANLNRCVFFSPDDAARSRLKAVVVAEKGKALYPDAAITPFLQRVEDLPESTFADADFVFGCLDNLNARLHANAHAYGKSVLVDGGTTGFFGKVQVVKAPSACLECGMKKADYDFLWKKYSCVGDLLDWLDPKMPALPTTTSVIAGLQAQEFVKLVHGRDASALVGKYLFYNGLDAAKSVYALGKRRACPVHAHEQE